MLNKLDDLAALIAGEDPDIIMLSETWTNENVTNAELCFNGYILQSRKDRQDTLNGRGGGVILYTREGLTCCPIESNWLYKQTCGAVVNGVEVHVVYRSPNASIEDNHALNSFLENRKPNSKITGDFNYPGVDWNAGHSNDPQETKFLDTTISEGLTQVIETATHEKGNCLDLVLTNIPNRIDNIDVNVVDRLSDHYVISFDIQGVENTPKSIEQVLDLAKANFPRMRHDLAEVNWHKELDGLDATQTWSKFANLFNHIQKQWIPLKTRRLCDQPLWMRPNVLRTIRKKRRLYDHYKSTGSLQSLLKYRSQVNLAQKSVREAKKQFEDDIGQKGKATHVS